jgi:predicted ATP-dependent protease
VAARRLGIRRVLVPRGNEKDLVDIHKEARRGIELIPVSTMDEVLEHAMARPVLHGPVSESAAALPSELTTPASLPVKQPPPINPVTPPAATDVTPP